MKFPYKVEKYGTTFLSVKDPRWANRNGNLIACTMEIDPLGVVEYGAASFDDEPHGRELFEFLVNGGAGPVAPYERRDVTVEDLKEELNKLMPDILLGLATQDEIELARLLRLQIKEMSE